MEHRRRPIALFMIAPLRRCIYLVSTGHRSFDSRGSKQPDFVQAASSHSVPNSFGFLFREEAGCLSESIRSRILYVRSFDRIYQAVLPFNCDRVVNKRGLELIGISVIG